MAVVCGYCAARWQNNEPPRPVARVCRSCGLGLLLYAREDAAPGERDAFLVVDRSLRVQALSRCAETLLGVCEEAAVQRPVGELLVCADAQAQSSGALVDAIMNVNADSGRPVGVMVRPAGTFGLRMRGRIARCGPPRAALIVLQNLTNSRLRAVS